MSKHVYFLGGGKADGSAGDKNLLGGKGANLAPGFTISTDACRHYMHDGWPTGLDAEMDRHL